jgi:phosphoenolpyruvate carboxykinase (ATP)
MTFGRVNPQFSLEDQQISGLGDVYYNLTEPALVEAALKRGEGSLGKGGAFLVTTGKFTGRSPKDKHVVKTDSVADSIWWENNAEMSPEGFDALYQDMIAHMQGKDYFVQDLVGGADPKHAINVRMVTELAWHGLFIRTMLRRPDAEALKDFTADFTVINCPSFQADPAKHNCRSETVIAMNFDRKMILIGGTEYAGENKKSVFTLLNYLLPEKGIMPMHCSANHANGNPVDTAVFFGLSGTGKTTLSADPERTLIGDDEHGWSDNGTFNFEGGCYAKTINLNPEAEPEIYATTSKFGTVIENMVFDPDTFELDFDDDSLTANMRAAYPLHYISNASEKGRWRPPEEHHHADLRCLRRAASDRAAQPGAGDVSLPVWLHLQGGGYRTRRDRARAHFLHLLRRALHAAPPGGLRQPATRKDRPAWCHLLAG